MKRTAEETIRNLEVRIARLEKQSIFGPFKGKTPRYSVETEEKAFLRAFNSVRGVSKVSDIDLSNPKKLRMTVTYKGVDMELRGWCNSDDLGIYGGKVKESGDRQKYNRSYNLYTLYSPLIRKHLGMHSLVYQQKVETVNGSAYQFSFEYGIEEIHKGVKYYLGVEEEERLKAERHRESLRRQEIYRKEREEESEKNRQITRDRLERKRKKTEMYEANRARNEERRRNR